jgi:ribosomal-protein-alanine N-acetyltransferase
MPRETKHLILREYSEADAVVLFEIQGDREYMKFTHSTASPEASHRWLQSYEASRSRLGFAPWVLIHKASGRIAGWGGLNVDPSAPQWGPEVTYFIHPSLAGRGLATELVQESLQIGFEELGLSAIAAFTRPDNRASARVLAKCGFRFLRHESSLERDHYAIDGSTSSRAMPA